MSEPLALTKPGLARTLTVRLVLTTVLVMLLQAGIVSVRDYIGETDFLNGYVKLEARRLAREYAASDSRGQRTMGPPYSGPNDSAYAYRILDAEGQVVSSHNIALLAPLSPWTRKPSLSGDFWLRKLDAQQRMHVAGGLRVKLPAQDLWVEFATFGDPENTYLRTIAWDVLNDIWVPMLPLVLLSLFVTTISVRRSLRALVSAATRADEISALERGERLDIGQLPAEASHFASAINRLLDRVADLVSAQRHFIARAAHELRTPLSIMMLELGHLKDPSAKRLEADVREMSGIVDQLLALARMNAAEKPKMTPVDISTVVRELVGRMMAWAEKDGHSLTFEAHRTEPVIGDETSIRDATRNLIENAVKHTPAGTQIRIEVAQDGTIIVEDSGPGIGSHSPEELQLPFRKGSTKGEGAGLGLAIVRQAAELHGGRLSIEPSQLGGTRFAISFPSPVGQIAVAA